MNHISWPTCCVILRLACQGANAGPQLRLVLDDEFQGERLNDKYWTSESGPRKGAVNSPASVDVTDGVLRITTWTDESGATICGFVTTKAKVSIRRGRTEIRCRYRIKEGTQAAFWLTSDTYGKSGTAKGAVADGVEIDIMETHGLMRGAFQNALHWGPYRHPTEAKAISFQHPTKHNGQYWQKYGVDFSDGTYRFTHNGRTIWNERSAPLTTAPQYLLLTSESNPSGWSGKRPEHGYGKKVESQNILEVDWVKAWSAD